MSPAAVDWGRELEAGLWVGLGFAALFALAELWRRLLRPPVEWTRKAVHVGAGGIVCAFPWLFRSTLSVLVLCLAFALLLALARVLKLLPSVQAVDRASVGELLFPPSVLALFWVAHGRPVYYLIPMLILVLSDALAALVGKAYGRFRYDVDRGERKSLEGSLVFFLCSFLAIQVPLLLMTGLDRLLCVLAALQMAYLVTCFEAICLSGVDNLVIPLGGYYVLVQLVRNNVAWTEAQIAVQAFLALGTALLAWRYRIFSFSAALAVQLYLYGAFAFGDSSWLAAPSAVLLVFLALSSGESRASTAESARHYVLSLYYFVLGPLAVLILYNYLLAFTPDPPQGLILALPGVFSALHGAELACVGLALGLPSLDRVPPRLRLPLWSMAGAALAALAALPALACRGRLSAADLLPSLALGALMPGLYRLGLSLVRPSGRGFGRIRLLALSALLGTAAVLGWLWWRP